MGKRTKKLRKRLRKRGLDSALVICTGKRCAPRELTRPLVAYARDHAGSVAVTTVGCLNICKNGPIAASVCGKRVQIKKHVDAAKVTRMIDKLARYAPPTMYGLIGQMLAVPGKRDELAAILTASTTNLPGCRSYVIAVDTANADALWITEVWESKDHHAASLKLAEVQDAIAKARPLIAGFGHRFETKPLA